MHILRSATRLPGVPAQLAGPAPLRRLAIYLDDHLAGATAGLALARRAARNNREHPVGVQLRRLVDELEYDRSVLLSLRRSLGLASPLKRIGALGMERVARLKPNGQLVGYSPLSRLEELEGLCAGIDGKLALWHALAAARAAHPALAELDTEALSARAERQRSGLEPARREAARAAFADASTG